MQPRIIDAYAVPLPRDLRDASPLNLTARHVRYESNRDYEGGLHFEVWGNLHGEDPELIFGCPCDGAPEDIVADLTVADLI